MLEEVFSAVCVLLEGEHVGVLRGDAGQSLGVRCSQRRLSGLGGKTLPQHLSGGTACLTHPWKSHDPPGVQATHPQLSLSVSFQQGFQQGSSQRCMEENQIYASADEGKMIFPFYLLYLSLKQI